MVDELDRLMQLEAEGGGSTITDKLVTLRIAAVVGNLSIPA